MSQHCWRRILIKSRDNEIKRDISRCPHKGNALSGIVRRSDSGQGIKNYLFIINAHHGIDRHSYVQHSYVLYVYNLSSLFRSRSKIPCYLVKDFLVAVKRGECHLGFLELIDGTGENLIAYGELLTYFRIKLAPVV